MPAALHVLGALRALTHYTLSKKGTCSARCCRRCAYWPPCLLLPHPCAAAPSGGGQGGQDGDLDSRAAAAGAPRHFFCPVSLQIMRDPVVVAATGQT